MAQKLTVLTSDSKDIDTTPPRNALSKLHHVRDELARVYRHARTGKIPTAEATRLTYILATLAKIIEVSDLEKRITELEQKK